MKPRTIAFVVAAGVAAGCALCVLQFALTLPIIQIAERVNKLGTDRSEPSGGLIVLGSSVALAVGFAGMLAGLSGLTGLALTARNGCIWGVWIFLAAHVAPSVSLPAQPHGIAEAELLLQQAWWVSTTVLTALGLALFALRRTTAHAVIGVALLSAPHFLWSPLAAAADGSSLSANLLASFATRSIALAAAFWICLGALLGAALDLAKRPAPPPASAIRIPPWEL